ncbi:hypothetical protein WN48_07992 [Eufriesea mexicana]|nr:hypothetical protein WN48_07992 [Eufriesea mexicana]
MCVTATPLSATKILKDSARHPARTSIATNVQVQGLTGGTNNVGDTDRPQHTSIITVGNSKPRWNSDTRAENPIFLIITHESNKTVGTPREGGNFQSRRIRSSRLTTVFRSDLVSIARGTLAEESVFPGGWMGASEAQLPLEAGGRSSKAPKEERIAGARAWESVGERERGERRVVGRRG